MKRYLQNVTDMATNVSVFMRRNQTLWQTNTAIGETMDEIDADLATLAGVDTKAAAPVTGPAADKTVVRFDLENKILMIAGQIASLAAKNKDHTLEDQADLSFAASEAIWPA